MNKRKTIVFDFDGVIHVGYKGWRDGTIYGAIDWKLLDFIEELMEDYYVVISSNRPAKQIVDFFSNYNLGVSFEVFNKTQKNMYWEKESVIGVTNEKAVGILYIDDRGYRYTSKANTEENIEDIKKVIKDITKR